MQQQLDANYYNIKYDNTSSLKRYKDVCYQNV
jgi:hypothetical protein